MPFNWRQATSHADPLCCHLFRDGRPIGITVSEGRRVQHPDHGVRQLLTSDGQGTWRGGRNVLGNGNARLVAAHRVGTPCPPAWTEAVR